MAKRTEKRAEKKTPTIQTRKVWRGVRRTGSELTVSFTSIDVRRNGWPGPDIKETDLSLIVQIENPSGAEESRIIVTDRLPLKARAGQVVTAGDLTPGASGVPFFNRPVVVNDHVNFHVRFFIERSNALGPIVGAALNTVVSELAGRIPLLPRPAKEALHIQIGKTIATELARATVIIPVEASMEGHHDLTVALISPRTIPGVYAPTGSPVGHEKGFIATEGELAAVVYLGMDLKLAKPS